MGGRAGRWPADERRWGAPAGGARAVIVGRGERLPLPRRVLLPVPLYRLFRRGYLQWLRLLLLLLPTEISHFYNDVLRLQPWLHTRLYV